MRFVPHRLRQATRRLLLAPAFALAAALTLAIGIGATTAVFSLVNGVLLRPLPYPHADRLVDLSHTLTISGASQIDQSDATYLYYRRANHTLSGVGAYQATAASLGPVDNAASGDQGPAERVAAARISASMFRVLQITPLRGRTFVDAEDRPDAPPVALIGEQLWRRKYGADASIIGRQIEIDGRLHQVVGIIPASIRFPAPATELWLPIGIDSTKTASAAFDYRAVARLRDGVSLAAATADLQRLLPEVPVAFPGRLTTDGITMTRMRAVVRPMRDAVVGNIGHVLWVVLGGVACVLLIACANVANLFLVRAEGRQHEVAVRRALGAGPGTIVADFLAEGGLLATVGGGIGLVFAAIGDGILRSLPAGVNIPRLDEVGIDGVVLAVACGITVLAAIMVSVFPALRAARASVAIALAESSRSATAGRGRHRARHALVITQVALALVLVAGAGLMARSFAQLRSVKPGFDAAHSYAFRVALPQVEYPGAASATGFVNDALDRIGGLAGIQAAGVVSKLPLDAEARQDTALYVEDRPAASAGMAGAVPDLHQVAYASPDYFRAMGIPVLAGHTFERPDPMHAVLEVVLSRTIAERYWTGGRAIGRRVRMEQTGPWYTVVGVVGDVHGTALDQPPDELVYLPLVTAPGATTDHPEGDGPWTPHAFAFVVRTAGSGAGVAAAAERAVQAIAPGVPVYGAHAMAEAVARATARTSFTLLLLGIASLAALALGAVGIYGVISYVVSLRTREIAVRLALGAQPADVQRMVSREAITVAAVGIVLGLVGAVAVTRFLATLLFGVAPTDPATLAAAAVLLTLVAILASWWPARCAAGVDPARALRAE